MHEGLNLDDIVKKIKGYLGVTWTYQDDEIHGLVEDGIAKIEAVSSSTDFTQGLGWKLLKTYCRYAWDGSEAYFEDNYKKDLLQLQLENFKRDQGGRG